MDAVDGLIRDLIHTNRLLSQRLSKIEAVITELKNQYDVINEGLQLLGNATSDLIDQLEEKKDDTEKL